MHLEITLPFTKLCDAFTGYFDYLYHFVIVLSFFFCHLNFMKEGYSKLSKNEAEICFEFTLEDNEPQLTVLIWVFLI